MGVQVLLQFGPLLFDHGCMSFLTLRDKHRVEQSAKRSEQCFPLTILFPTKLVMF
jgi:hypothetical protein